MSSIAKIRNKTQLLTVAELTLSSNSDIWIADYLTNGDYLVFYLKSGFNLAARHFDLASPPNVSDAGEAFQRGSASHLWSWSPLSATKMMYAVGVDTEGNEQLWVSSVNIAGVDPTPVQEGNTDNTCGGSGEDPCEEDFGYLTLSGGGLDAAVVALSGDRAVVTAEGTSSDLDIRLLQVNIPTTFVVLDSDQIVDGAPNSLNFLTKISGTKALYTYQNSTPRIAARTIFVGSDVIDIGDENVISTSDETWPLTGDTISLVFPLTDSTRQVILGGDNVYLVDVDLEDVTVVDSMPIDTTYGIASFNVSPEGNGLIISSDCPANCNIYGQGFTISGDVITIGDLTLLESDTVSFAQEWVYTIKKASNVFAVFWLDTTDGLNFIEVSVGANQLIIQTQDAGLNWAKVADEADIEPGVVVGLRPVGAKLYWVLDNGS